MPNVLMGNALIFHIVLPSQQNDELSAEQSLNARVCCMCSPCWCDIGSVIGWAIGLLSSIRFRRSANNHVRPSSLAAPARHMSAW